MDIAMKVSILVASMVRLAFALLYAYTPTHTHSICVDIKRYILVGLTVLALNAFLTFNISLNFNQIRFYACHYTYIYMQTHI